MRVRTVIMSAGLVLTAQSTLSGQTEFGVKAGASFGNIKNKGLLPGSLETRTGAAAGLFLGYRAAIFGVGVEGLYAQRGARSDQDVDDAATRLDYIDLPVYVKVSIPASVLRPFIYAGPQVSFEVKCRTAGGSADCPDTGRKQTDYAAVIGAGLRIGQKMGLSLEGRYVYGLADLKLATVTSSESYKNRTFMVLLGLGI